MIYVACAKYILTFINDFYRFAWVYFLKKKSRVFEIFKEFKALVENQCGRPIKFLRSDNGGEYVGQPFEEYILVEICTSHPSTKWSHIEE